MTFDRCEQYNKKNKENKLIDNNNKDFIYRGCLLDNCQSAVRTSNTQNKSNIME